MLDVIDADGHLSEDYADIRNFYSGPLKERVGGGPLMPRDHLHVTTDSLDPGTAKGTPDEWLEFLDKAPRSVSHA